MSGAGPASRGRRPYLIPVLLFLASAAFVLWRNTDVGVLVDIAYVLNTATRIAAGDVPYAQFPLAQAPLEFVIQAVLIKAFGPHFAVTIAYASILGGTATVLTYLIVRRILAGMPGSEALAAIITLPLIPLGIYAIYPHPFYDSDACLLIVGAIAAILAARDQPTARRWLIAGALVAVPIFMKQNIGGAFLALAVTALAIQAFLHPATRAGFRWFAAGATVALVVGIGILQLVVGLDSYIRWAWTFALAGRGVALGRLQEFVDPKALFPAALLLIAVLLAQRIPVRARAPLFVLSFALFGIWGAFTLALLAPPISFPAILVAASVLAVARMSRERATFDHMLPLVVAGTTLGTLQSQGVAGSTFGIFPLLVIAIASLTRDLARFVPLPSRIAPLTGVAIAGVIAMSGAVYTIANVRLTFIDVNAAGPVHHATFPSLAGLSARGPYLADLDEMLTWARDNIPANDPVAFLPGEEPAFYALGWRPRLPSVYFYDVATPYTPAEMARFANDVGLRWVFVKDRLQLGEVPPLEQALVTELTKDATLFTHVGPYRVYKRG